MPFSPDNIPAEYKKSSYLCPFCKLPLFYLNDDDGVRIWCPYEVCKVIGAGEGAHARNEKEAYSIFMRKMGFEKN